jgi:hypothetical protein
LIEQSLVLIDQCERMNNLREVDKLKKTLEQAKNYKSDLVDLLDINFEKPNNLVKEIAEKFNFDLKDPNVKNQFHMIKKDYIERINKFYNDNLLSGAGQPQKKTKKMNKTNQKTITNNNNGSENNIKQDKINKNNTGNSNKNIVKDNNLLYLVVGVIVILSILLYFLINDN